MFKKKPTIKTLSPLRSSDRRKTADKIILDYSLQPQTSQPADGQDEKTAATAAHTALRNSLLPDNALSAKFSTTSGPNLKEVHGTLYIGNHGSEKEQRVLWIKMEEKLYPTVYTLWHNPGIIPLLHTPSVVIGKIRGGADLMTPGLAGPPFPQKATKGAVVAVASIENPTVPVVVGTCAIDISSLETARGAKGHAVDTLHWEGDEIWDWSTSGKAGNKAPDNIEGWGMVQDGGLAQQMKSLAVEEEELQEDGGVALSNDEAVVPEAQHRNNYVDGEDIAEVIDTNDGPEMTTSEIDHTFRQAFIYGVHNLKETNNSPPKYGLTFPLAQSYILSHLVLPFLPIHTPKQAELLTIKKTSWKNARKFLKALEKDKLVLCKDRTNEVEVWDIDFDDRAFVDFQPYRLPKKEPSGGPSETNGASNGGQTADDSKGQKLRVATIYRPKDSLSPFFDSSPKGSKSLHTAADIRPLVTNYIENNNLVSAQNRRLVSLDPIISNAVLTNPNDRTDAQYLAQGTIPRDVLIDRVLKLCSPYYAILRNDEELDLLPSGKGGAKAKAGAPPRIEIILETRSGNKTVTRVHGLEAYYIKPSFLAEELRKSCASSTTVEEWKAGGKGLLEVMVQGPQKEAVIKALDKRGVQKAWVDIQDKTKGKKKG